MKPIIACFSHMCNLSYITGAEKLMLFLLRELSHAYTCVLVVPEHGMLSRQAEAYGIRCRIQPCPLFFEMVHPNAMLYEQIEMAKHLPEWHGIVRVLQEIQPDYVFINTSVHVLPAIAAYEQQIPVLWQITELIHHNTHTEMAVRLIQQHAALVIGISDTVLQPFHQHPASARTLYYKLPPSWHMETLEPATWPYARESLRMQLGIPGSACLIGYISSAIYAHKGLEHFIQMGLSLLTETPSLHFLIVGEPHDPDYLKRCLKLTEYMGHSDRFHVLEFEPRVQQVYPAMDIVVIPSLQPEGFGMTALEGMLFGKAVVSYRAGGLQEIHEMTGNAHYTAECGNMRELMHIVEQLAAYPEERQHLGQHNARAALEAYGVAAFRRRLEPMFVELVMEREDWFPAIQGSSNLVYIRVGRAYRPMRHLHELAEQGITAPRRIAERVLQALPKLPAPDDNDTNRDKPAKRRSSPTRRLRRRKRGSGRKPYSRTRSLSRQRRSSSSRIKRGLKRPIAKRRTIRLRHKRSIKR